MHSKVVILSLLLAISVASGSYLNSIYVDVVNGQIYIADNQHLYEVDNVALTQNGYHVFPDGVTDDSLYVKKIGNKRMLYALIGTDTYTNMATFKTPVPNQVNLAPVNNKRVASTGLSLDPVYDSVDNIAIISPSRNLTIVHLNTLTPLDSYYEWAGSRIFGRNIVYNNVNNHLYVFRTRVPYQTPVWGLSVDEFDLSDNTFIEVETTYNCGSCGDLGAANESDFYQTILEDCAITYTSAAVRRIWCGDNENSKLFNFNADNLGKYQVIKTGTHLFDGVAWDFPNNKAFLVKVGDDGLSFTIHKLDMTNGNVIESKTITTTVLIDVSIMKVDPSQPHLYIATYSDLDTDPAAFIFVNTNTLAARTITLSQTA